MQNTDLTQLIRLENKEKIIDWKILKKLIFQQISEEQLRQKNIKILSEEFGYLSSVPIEHVRPLKKEIAAKMLSEHGYLSERRTGNYIIENSNKEFPMRFGVIEMYWTSDELAKKALKNIYENSSDYYVKKITD